MASKSWISGAPAIAQVETLTIGGTPSTGDTYSVTMGLNNTKTITYTAGSGDVRSTIAANLQALLAACLYGEFEEETWVNASVAPLTAPTTPILGTATTGGSIGASTTVWIIITYVNAYGETTGSTTTSISVGSGTSTNTVTVPSPAAQGSGVDVATGWNAYVGSGPSQPANTAMYVYPGGSVAIGSNLTITSLPGSGNNPPTLNTSDSGILTVTANTAGMPFTLSVSKTGTGTFSASTTTTSSGPNDVSLAANWSTNALPVNGDDVYISNTSQGLLYNLSALSGVTLNSLTWDTTFTGNAGLPAQNVNGYAEYRPLNFQISASTENYLPGTGGGSPLIQRDNGTVQWTVNVAATGSPQVQGRPALLLKGTNANNVLNITRGNVGSAIDAGDTATWLNVNVGYQTSKQNDVTLMLGAGCTLTTITQNGGQVSARTAVTTWTQDNGSATFYGTGALTTLDVEGGTFSYQSNGTLTSLTVGVDGTIDFSSDPRSRTVTNATVYGTLLDPNKSVTFTNPISFPEGVSGKSGASVDFGREIHLQRS